MIDLLLNVNVFPISSIARKICNLSYFIKIYLNTKKTSLKIRLMIQSVSRKEKP